MTALPTDKSSRKSNSVILPANGWKSKRTLSNLPLSRNTTDCFKRTYFLLSDTALWKTSIATNCKIICSHSSGKAKIALRKNSPISYAVSSTSPQTISKFPHPWRKSYCHAIRPRKAMRSPTMKKPSSCAIVSKIRTALPPLPFWHSYTSECGRANLQPYASLAMSGWRLKRVKNGSAKTSFYVGLHSRRWYAKSCLISILQKRVPPIFIRSLRRSNEYFRTTMSTNCGIHTSAVAKSAA